MRWLWAGILVLVGAGAWLALRSDGQPRKTPDSTAGLSDVGMADPVPTPPQPPLERTDKALIAANGGSSVASEPTGSGSSHDGVLTAPLPSPPALSVAPLVPTVTPVPDVKPDEVPALPIDIDPLKALADAATILPTADAAKPASGDQSRSDATKAAATEPAAVVTLENHKDHPLDKVVPSKAEKRADGALVLDGRFVLKGEGTKAKPYIVPWELLAATEEVYKPRKGLRKLPQRVTILHDKYIRITGFVAFPIQSVNPKECLVMLNEWDGCCIGVMPTPFDGIECRLATNASGRQRLAVHGTLEGRFLVDPYEDGGWVIGIFLLEDGVLTLSD